MADSNAIADLQSYLATYPEGRFVGVARGRVAALEAAEAARMAEEEEKALWGRVAESDAIADLQCYLDTYPEGRFVGEARGRVAALKAAEVTRMVEEEEKALWGRVAESDAIADLQSYLDTDPEPRRNM